MHYYTPELWDAVNSDAESERTAAEKQWQSNAEAYALQLQKDLKKMPGKVRQVIREIDEKWGGLHDFALQEMTFQNEVRRRPKALAVLGQSVYTYSRQCMLRLHNGAAEVVLRLENVTAFQMAMDDHRDGRGDNWWGYCEFSCREAEIELDVLWDSYDTGHLCFKNIALESRPLINEG